MRKAVSDARVVRPSRRIAEQKLAPRRVQDVSSSYLGSLINSMPVARSFPVRDFVAVITEML